jgi:hypothetical protein
MVWFQTQLKTQLAFSRQGCYPDPTMNRGFLAGLDPGRGSKYSVPTPFAPIEYLSTDRIVTWPIRKLCRIMCSVTSHVQIWDEISFQKMAAK